MERPHLSHIPAGPEPTLSATLDATRIPLAVLRESLRDGWVAFPQGIFIPDESVALPDTIHTVHQLNSEDIGTRAQRYLGLWIQAHVDVSHQSMDSPEVAAMLEADLAFPVLRKALGGHPIRVMPL